jgi:hypothetical protein
MKSRNAVAAVAVFLMLSPGSLFADCPDISSHACCGGGYTWKTYSFTTDCATISGGVSTITDRMGDPRRLRLQQRRRHQQLHPGGVHRHARRLAGRFGDIPQSERLVVLRRGQRLSQQLERRRHPGRHHQPARHELQLVRPRGRPDAVQGSGVDLRRHHDARRPGAAGRRAPVRSANTPATR